MLNIFKAKGKMIFSDLVDCKENEDLLINHYGPITSLMDDPSVTEIMINGIETIYLERQGALEKVESSFETIEMLNQFIVKILLETNQHISQATPILNGQLKNGSRINIVLNPTASNGPLITIRKQNFKALTVASLLKNKMFPKHVYTLLEKLVHEKRNIIICGGTGSGKTTLMNALLSMINHCRIVVIEDTQEIKLLNEHTIYMKSNNHWDESMNITIGQLVKNALRMRPDRLIVGEVRGCEAFDMIQAMNTGHSGSMTTGHCNGGLDMLYRLEMMVLSELKIPFDAIRHQIASALDYVIYVERKDERRVLSEIIAVKGIKDGGYDVERFYKLD